MSLDRTASTEQKIDVVIEGIELRRGIATRNKRKRYRPSGLEPYRSMILSLHDRGRSLEDIRFALASGIIPQREVTLPNGDTKTVFYPKIHRAKTTIHDFIKQCRSGG